MRVIGRRGHERTRQWATFKALLDDLATVIEVDEMRVRVASGNRRGGGHTWPGGNHQGKVSRDFNASARMWTFFAAHAMP